MGGCWHSLWCVVVQVVALVPLLGVVVVMEMGVVYVGVLVVRDLLGKMGRHVKLPSFLARLKTRAAAALTECTHLGEDRCIALDVVVVVRGVGVTPTLDVESTTHGCVVSFGDVVAMGVVHLAVFLPLFYLPLGMNL